jgi:hypothetical protein
MDAETSARILLHLCRQPRRPRPDVPVADGQSERPLREPGQDPGAGWQSSRLQGDHAPGHHLVPCPRHSILSSAKADASPKPCGYLAVNAASRGASERRYEAMTGDVQRLKLLAEPHTATLRNDKDSYGMQEVRGSNP